MRNCAIGLTCLCLVLVFSGAARAETTAPPLEKPGWTLTFHDEFDRPQLNDMRWYSAYRSGRKEYFQRIGHKSRWVDHNAHYVIEDGLLKLRIAEDLPFRPDKGTPCVSCIQTSDHRFGATTADYQILDKFAQKHGWFEIRARCPRGEGLLSAFWLHQHDPTKQEYTPEGARKELGDGVVEIDIIELQGRNIHDDHSIVNLSVHFTESGHGRPRLEFDASEDFHVYAMEWQEGRVDWYVDGEVVCTYEGPTPQEKMFVLLALFQYSGWIGTIDPNMAYPRDFEVDYVRVYARDEK